MDLNLPQSSAIALGLVPKDDKKVTVSVFAAYGQHLLVCGEEGHVVGLNLDHDGGLRIGYTYVDRQQAAVIRDFITAWLEATD